MKNSHYYPHSGGILGRHAYVDFQQTNYLLNVTICEKLKCAHKLQTISDAFSHIASRFLKVALAIKFALNWLAGPQCGGAAVQSETRRRERVTKGCYDRVRYGPQRTGQHHLGHDGYVGVSTGRLPPWQVSSNAARIAAVLRLYVCTPVCRLCGRYLAILGKPIRITVPSVTVAPTALVGSLIRSSNLPHSVQRGVQSPAVATQYPAPAAGRFGARNSHYRLCAASTTSAAMRRASGTPRDTDQ